MRHLPPPPPPHRKSSYLACTLPPLAGPRWFLYRTPRRRSLSRMMTTQNPAAVGTLTDVLLVVGCDLVLQLALCILGLVIGLGFGL